MAVLKCKQKHKHNIVCAKMNCGGKKKVNISADNNHRKRRSEISQMNRHIKRRKSEKQVNEVSTKSTSSSDTEGTSDALKDMGVGILHKPEYRSNKVAVHVGRRSMNGISKKNLHTSTRVQRHSFNIMPPQSEENGCSSSQESFSGSVVSSGEITPGITRRHESETSENFFLFRRKKPPGEDVFSKLSDEMLLSIFQYLPKKMLTRCCLVSKRWYRIASDEALWTRLDLGLRTITRGGLGYALQRGVLILRLSQSEVPNPVFLPSCPFATKDSVCKLQYLDLSMAVISAEGLADILQVCRHLRKLSLEHCTLNEMSCMAIGQNHNLEVLNLALCYGITDEYMHYIVSGCRRLSSLNLAWINLSECTLDVLCPNLPQSMCRLNISGCRRTLNDSHVQQLVEACPELLELDVSDCTSLTGLTIDAVCELKRIEYLAFSRCYSIPAQTYLQLGNISSLLYLDIFSLLTEQSLVGLQQVLPGVNINKFLFSSVARPTVGIRRSSIWGLRVRD